MNGTVARLRSRGVEALMDSDTSSIVMKEELRFEVYRVVNGVETVLATMFPKRSKGPNMINLNHTVGTMQNETAGLQVGDLVRSV